MFAQSVLEFGSVGSLLPSGSPAALTICWRGLGGSEGTCWRCIPAGSDCILSPALSWLWVGPRLLARGLAGFPRTHILPGKPGPELPADMKATHQGRRGDVMVGLKVYLLLKMAHVGPGLPGLEAPLLWGYFTQDNEPVFCLRAGGLPSASLAQPTVRRGGFLAVLGFTALLVLWWH